MKRSRMLDVWMWMSDNDYFMWRWCSFECTGYAYWLLIITKGSQLMPISWVCVIYPKKATLHVNDVAVLLTLLPMVMMTMIVIQNMLTCRAISSEIDNKQKTSFFQRENAILRRPSHIISLGKCLKRKRSRNDCIFITKWNNGFHWVHPHINMNNEAHGWRDQAPLDEWLKHLHFFSVLVIKSVFWLLQLYSTFFHAFMKWKRTMEPNLVAVSRFIARKTFVI